MLVTGVVYLLLYDVLLLLILFMVWQFIKQLCESMS